MADLAEKLRKFRVWEFITCIVVIVLTFAITSSIELHKRPIPRVEIRLNASHTVYARDPSIDLKKGKEQVPMWLAVVIYYAVPLAAHVSMQWREYVPNDTRDFVLAVAISSAITQLLTNFAKVAAGRFRPSFYDMCDWDYSVVWDGISNLCQNSKGENEARKSFPSGHSSGAFSTLFLVTLYLIGRSKMLTKSKRELEGSFLLSVNFFLAFIPTVVALWIAITRSQDNWHHYSDILAGSVIGIAAALIAYINNYASIFDYKSAGLPRETYIDLVEKTVNVFDAPLVLRHERDKCMKHQHELLEELEAVKRQRIKENEHFTREYSQFEGRLLRANSTLEKNRHLLEASMREKDETIKQMQTQLEKLRLTIDCLKHDPRIQFAKTNSFNLNDINTENPSKIHELERQVSKLFTEIQNEQTIKEEQAHQIEALKAANSKLLKALKKMKSKMEESQNSGVNHMLQDLQHKYIKLESEKQKLEVHEQNSKQEIDALRMEVLNEKSRYDSKCMENQNTIEELEATKLKVSIAEDQIAKLQRYVSDLETDYKLMGKIDGDTAEIELAQRMITRKNEELVQLERKFKEAEVELIRLRSIYEEAKRDEDGSKSQVTLIDLDHIYSQAMIAESKASNFCRIVSLYENGQHKNIEALLVNLDDHIECAALTSSVEAKQMILMSLMQTQSIMDNLSQKTMEILASNIGMNCAMQ